MFLTPALVLRGRLAGGVDRVGVATARSSPRGRPLLFALFSSAPLYFPRRRRILWRRPVPRAARLLQIERQLSWGVLLAPGAFGARVTPVTCRVGRRKSPRNGKNHTAPAKVVIIIRTIWRFPLSEEEGRTTPRSATWLGEDCVHCVCCIAPAPAYAHAHAHAHAPRAPLAPSHQPTSHPHWRALQLHGLRDAVILFARMLSAEAEMRQETPRDFRSEHITPSRPQAWRKYITYRKTLASSNCRPW